MTLFVKQFLLCCILTVSCSVYGATKITINGNAFSFETKPRMVDVLAPLALQEDWYWSASSLYRIGDNDLNAKRNEVINKLEKLLKNDSLGIKQQNAIAILINQILQWKLAERIPIVIDYDFARTNTSRNPLFDEGEYQLNLLKRPGKVYVFGALLDRNTLNHKNAADVSEYITTLPLTSHNDKDYVYIIQADGRTQRVPYAYWNRGHQEIMPGSQLYVPFRPQFFSSGNEELNEQIVFLAANRILP